MQGIMPSGSMDYENRNHESPKDGKHERKKRGTRESVKIFVGFFVFSPFRAFVILLGVGPF